MALQRSSARYHAAMFTRPPGGFWHRHDVDPYQPEGVALTDPLPAVVNEGRWLVSCPCGNGILVAEDVDRVFCVDCLNEAAGGAWQRVAWPADAEKIETALLARPRLAMRHWTPHETVDDLIAENVEHGVIDEADVPKRVKALLKRRRQRGPHVVAPGTIVHPDSEMA